MKHDAFNPWPLGIITSFVLFISGAAVFITWAVGQNMDLVRKDYYDHEILFQRRIDEVQRTKPLHSQISLSYDTIRRTVRIQLPVSHVSPAIIGRIHVYRPSDARLDRSLPLALAPDGSQQIQAADWRDGLWKVQISWELQGEKYYYEQPILIGGASS